jgi:isopentenyldiphosphate isomerase
MGNHLLDVVDENDEVIGQAFKDQKALQGYISRVAAVFLCDLENNIFICKRAAHKKYSPNLYDLAAVGAVLQGETYEEASMRELEEELGVKCDLQMLDKFYQEAEAVGDGKKLKYFCAVFLGKTDAKPILNEELSEIRKMSWDELQLELKNNLDKFCPGFINDFRQVEEKLEKIIKSK